MAIIGIDIGKTGTGVACVLHGDLENVPAYFHSIKNDKDLIFKIKPCHEDVSKILFANPEAIIMEPTGGHYSRFWHHVGKVYKIPVLWVGHADVKHFRETYDFPNKDDRSDALTMATLYYNKSFVDRFGRKRFISYHVDDIETIRDLFLELEQLDKIHNQQINQLRQRLGFEFPEIAGRAFNLSPKLGFCPWIGWIAGIHSYSRINNDHDKSIAKALGIDIDEYTQHHAKSLCVIDQRRLESEKMLRFAMNRPHFKPYMEVFSQCGLGLSMQALMLCAVYPFEKFLLNGEPFVEWEIGKNEIWYRRNRSERWFQAYLGMKRKIEQSGDKTKIKWFGSKLIRAHLYAWALAVIAPSNSSFRSSEVGAKLGKKWDELTKQNVPGKDRFFRVLFPYTRYLYKALLSALVER